MAGNSTAEATTIGRQLRGAKEAEPWSFAFALAKTAAESAMAVDKSKQPKSLEAEAKKTGGNGARVFSGKVYCDGSEAVFLTDGAPSNGEKGITDWFKHHKVSLSVSIDEPVEGDDEADEEGPKIYLTETLLQRFRFAMRNPVNFAFGPGKEKDESLLALHPRRGGRTMFRGIKRQNHAIRGNWGVLNLEGRIATFTCDEKPIPGLRKQIRAFLRSRDLRYRVKIMGPEGEVIEPGDEEEDAADLAAEPQEEQQEAEGQEASPQQATPPAPDAQPQAQDDGGGTGNERLAAMKALVDRMMPTLQEVVQKVPSHADAIRTQHRAYDTAVKAGDVGAAQTAVDALRELGRVGRADIQALATMRERLDAQLPELQKQFQQRDAEGAALIRDTWRQCDNSLKAGDVAGAREAMFELASMMRAPIRAPQGGTRPRPATAPVDPQRLSALQAAWPSARAAWQDAIETVDGQISNLQKALRDSGDEELEEIAEFGLNAITDNHKTPLMAALLEMGAGAPTAESFASAGPRALAAVRAFRAHIERDERVAACDESPGALTSIRATLGPALAGLEAALAG